jgi:hypothetical protein
VISAAARAATRAAIGFLAAVIATTCAACAAGALLGMAPQVAEVTGMAVGAQIDKAKGNPDEIGGVAADDQADRCDEIARTTPGVEEIRLTKDGMLESRQWRLVHSGGTPAWMMSPTKTAPADGWEPKPAISRLEFNPPLKDMVKAGGDSAFVAYVPSAVRSPADSDRFDALTSGFGPTQGNFKWHDAIYDYTVVPKLPCFKPVK